MGSHVVEGEVGRGRVGGSCHGRCRTMDEGARAAVSVLPARPGRILCHVMAAQNMLRRVGDGGVVSVVIDVCQSISSCHGRVVRRGFAVVSRSPSTVGGAGEHFGRPNMGQVMAIGNRVVNHGPSHASTILHVVGIVGSAPRRVIS